MDPSFEFVQGVFSWFIPIFFVVVALILGAIIVVVVRNYRAARTAGLDPFTAETQLLGQLKNSELLRPASPIDPVVSPRGLGSRLDEVDALLREGRIDAAEHERTRRRLLDEV
ncbi:MAG: hypothetical protein IPO80_06855 [Propionibacteriaceae bacterium]|nr:hypothetical protein [Propionibacteriaceae bacterium]